MKNWFKTSPYWFKGGAIGAFVCVALFAFYILIYFPVVLTKYRGSLPDGLMSVPLYTGHLYPLLTGSLLDIGQNSCPGVTPFCVSWNIESGCTHQVMTPSQQCVEAVNRIAFLAACVALVSAYAFIGALIGFIFGKIKNRKVSS